MTTAPADPAAAPVEQQEPIPCPMCEYDLRGQVEPRCPECGYQFDWDELRDPSRRLHRYLFEHHPEANVSSFFRTLIGGLRPGRFWRELLPVQPSRPRRLWAYFLIVWATTLIPPVALLVYTVVTNDAPTRANRARAVTMLAGPQGQAIRQSPQYRGMTNQQIIDQAFPFPPLHQRIIHAGRQEIVLIALVISGFALFTPLATIAAMMVFRISMRRARVRPIHAVRCVLYSVDVLFWTTLAFTALIGWKLLQQVGGAWELVTGWILVIAYLAFLSRLARSFKLYLRFNQSIATVVATQVIAALLAANVAQFFVMVFD